MIRSHTSIGWSPNYTPPSGDSMVRSFTENPLAYYGSETPYAPGYAAPFGVGINLPVADDSVDTRHVDVEAFEPMEFARRHASDDDFNFVGHHGGVDPWNTPATPELVPDGSSYYSSAMSREGSMLSTYHSPGITAPYPLNNDMFVPKTEFTNMGIGLDHFSQDSLMPFMADGTDRDALFSPTQNMSRTASCMTTVSASNDILADMNHGPLDREPLRRAAAASYHDDSSTTSSANATAGSTHAPNRKIGIPRSRHPAARLVEHAHKALICDKCNRNPDGFRGEHELMRHCKLFHCAKAVKWVCIDRCAEEGLAVGADRLAPKLALADCANCRNGKLYGQYYNAAAHLRRFHFHPKPRGRPKGDERRRRAGSAGGSDPKIEVLKRYWLRSIEVDNSGRVAQEQAVAEEDEEEEFDDLELLRERERERRQADARRANEEQLLSALGMAGQDRHRGRRREERAGKMEMTRLWGQGRIDEVETEDHDKVAFNSYY